MMTDTKQTARKLFFVILLSAPIFILLVTFSTLTGSAATATTAQHQALATPTPTTETNLQPQDTGSPISIFLPIIYKTIFQQPLVAAYGPVIDPPVPSDNIEAQSTVIIDPGFPTPPTPLPGQPTWTPTPGPGTPTVTPTPKPSLTPTVMPTATEILVPAGGFETQSARDSWFEFSLKDYNLIFDEDADLPQAPGGAFEGNWYVWLGGDNSEISYIERQFTVPTNYTRHYFGYRARFQSYDSVCATTKYSTMLQADRDEMLAGHLRHATSGTLDIFGVDLGGTIICVNRPGRSGCSNDSVQDLSGGRKAVYVVYYDLCNVANGTGWNLFLFPISPVVGGPNLAGQDITVQIKTITDSQLSSSILIDNVAFIGGPPLPTPTATPIGSASVQTQDTLNIGEPVLAPVLAPEIPPDITGAQIIPSKTNPGQPSSLDTVWQK